jgi:hypothetical protein
MCIYPVLIHAVKTISIYNIDSNKKVEQSKRLEKMFEIVANVKGVESKGKIRIVDSEVIELEFFDDFHCVRKTEKISITSSFLVGRIKEIFKLKLTEIEDIIEILIMSEKIKSEAKNDSDEFCNTMSEIYHHHDELSAYDESYDMKYHMDLAVFSEMKKAFLDGKKRLAYKFGAELNFKPCEVDSMLDFKKYISNKNTVVSDAPVKQKSEYQIYASLYDYCKDGDITDYNLPDGVHKIVPSNDCNFSVFSVDELPKKDLQDYAIEHDLAYVNWGENEISLIPRSEVYDYLYVVVDGASIVWYNDIYDIEEA